MSRERLSRRLKISTRARMQLYSIGYNGGNMYRVDRNNFYLNEKRATVFTPDYVSEFLFELLNKHIPKRAGTIIDPCVGRGALLKPWKQAGYTTLGT